MKNIGIVRKIDRLGRVVIPKEIRNTLRIIDDDNLELLVDGENIILKKYSYMKNFEDISKNLINSMNIKDETVVLYDSKSIIYSIGKYKNISNLSNELLEYMNTYEPVLGKGKIKINDELTLDITYYIKPILSNGIVIGVLLLFSLTNLNEKDINIINYIGDFLGGYIYS
nr:AbrB/MazE/SpoVT family DNA-binding domain-containing protein [Bacilli bacterium]